MFQVVPVASIEDPDVLSVRQYGVARLGLLGNACRPCWIIVGPESFEHPAEMDIRRKNEIDQVELRSSHRFTGS
jgi:hypothetical protein